MAVILGVAVLVVSGFLTLRNVRESATLRR